MVGVVVDPAKRLVCVAGGPPERVAAALGDHVDCQAGAHRRRRVRPAGLDLGVLDHVRPHLHIGELEVVVVARLHAFQLHDVREVFSGVPEVHRPPAAVVEGPRVNAGRLLEEVGPVLAGGQRHLFLELAVDVQNVARLADLQHGRIARHGDRFGHGADLEGDVDLKVHAAKQLDSLAPVCPEPLEVRGDGVLARRQVDQTVVARLVGHGGCRRDHVGAGCGDRDTRQHATLVVFDVATQAAACRLRLCKHARTQHNEQAHPESQNTSHGDSSLPTEQS